MALLWSLRLCALLALRLGSVLADCTLDNGGPGESLERQLEVRGNGSAVSVWMRLPSITIMTTVFGMYPDLQRLSIADISGVAPEGLLHFRNLTSMMFLTLRGAPSDFTKGQDDRKDQWGWVGVLPNALKRLDITGLGAPTVSVPAWVLDMPDLVVTLGHMTDGSLTGLLPALPNLRISLFITDSPELTTDSLRHLGNVPRLRYLSLRGPVHGPINDALLDSLHKLDVLEWLELGHPNGAVLTDTTYAAVIRLVEECPKLFQLSLNVNTKTSQGVLNGLQKLVKIYESRFFRLRVPKAVYDTLVKPKAHSQVELKPWLPPQL